MMRWNEAWYRAQRRRVRVAMVAAVMLALVSVPAIALALTIIDGTEPELWQLLLGKVAFALFIMGLPLILVVRQMLIDRAVLLRVPRHDGLLCPRCRRALVRTPEVNCTRCKRVFNEDEVIRHWEQFPYSAKWKWVAGHGADRAPAWVRIRHRLQDRPLWAIVSCSSFLLVFSVVWALASGEPIVLSLLRFMPLAILVIGVCILSLGMRHRDKGLYCASCGYEKAADGGERCPECGSEWMQAGGLARERPGRSWTLIWLGATIMAFFLVGNVAHLLVGVQGRLDLTPTWLLFTQVESRQQQGLSPWSKWGELSSRPLTPADDTRLTDLMIDEVLTTTYGTPMGVWQNLAGRAMTETQRARLLRGLLAERDRMGVVGPDAESWLSTTVESGVVARPGDQPQDPQDDNR